MKNIIILFAVISLFFTSSCNQQKIVSDNENVDEVAAQLVQIWDDFNEAMLSKDIDKVLSHFTQDIINYPFYGSTQNGFEETKAFLADFMSNYPEGGFDFKQVEVKVFGDTAFEVSSMQGQRGFSIFKKHDDGSWKLYRWVGQQENSN
ncbi:YybH family protein [Draconibacterium mangrovi]|uniref:YybH family protein n=1 Tax=Draconibacterium mangrovi TaxID=2697469 RepID=UPI0013D630B3|nr:nuclear transport factor 2 family protein [Draconibacterium mangrovi]